MKLTSMMFALALVGCGGKKAEDDKVASCHAESVHSCREYRGGNLALGTKHVKDLCTVVISSAQFAEVPCPTTNVIASCQKDEGKDVYYTGYVQTAQEIETGCKAAGGTFATK